MICAYCGTRKDERNEFSWCLAANGSAHHVWQSTPAPARLPTDSAARKDIPVYSGVIRYFPRALAYIAKTSKAGNDKHNPGQPLHWSRDKSSDHLDCLARHLLDAETVDPEDGLLHAGKLAWRALAHLELKLEAEEKNAR